MYGFRVSGLKCRGLRFRVSSVGVEGLGFEV